MDIEWKEEARKEFLQLPKDIQRQIKSYVDDLPEKGLKWNKIDFLKREDLGLEVYRLKMMPEDDPALNHRAIFDVRNQKYVIYKVGKRPGFYEEENLREATERIQD